MFDALGFNPILTCSILVPLCVPMFYAVVQRICERVKGMGKTAAATD